MRRAWTSISTQIERANGISSPPSTTSSPLPPPMVANAHSTGIPVEPGARGFGFNADAYNLVRFLEVGTKVDVRD